MTYKTVEGVLHPDGTVTLPREELPDHAVEVMITILERGEETVLSEPGGYLNQLTDYEERLARGEIQWQLSVAKYGKLTCRPRVAASSRGYVRWSSSRRIAPIRTARIRLSCPSPRASDKDCCRVMCLSRLAKAV